MKKLMKMQVVHPHAAGIDIGSRSHYVAVGQDLDDVKEFDASHSEHLRMIDCLKELSITTIALKSPGSYWPSL